MTYEYEIVARKTPDGKKWSPMAERMAVTSKRGAVRAARREVRQVWQDRGATQYEVRANVYANGTGRPMLIRQVYINQDTAKNGWRKMLKDEEI